MTPIARKIVEAVQTVETLKRNMGHVLRFGEPKVDGDPGPAILTWRAAAPADPRWEAAVMCRLGDTRFVPSTSDSPDAIRTA